MRDQAPPVLPGLLSKLSGRPGEDYQNPCLGYHIRKLRITNVLRIMPKKMRDKSTHSKATFASIWLSSVRGHYKPVSNGRDQICVSRDVSFKQARINLGSFETISTHDTVD
jgi:hypothetical protein